MDLLDFESSPSQLLMSSGIDVNAMNMNIGYQNQGQGYGQGQMMGGQQPQQQPQAPQQPMGQGMGMSPQMNFHLGQGQQAQQPQMGMNQGQGAPGQPQGQPQRPPPTLNPQQQARMHQIATQRFLIMKELNSALIKLAIGSSSFHPPIAQGQQPNPDPEAYRAVMQRLQGNLIYMASIADRLQKTPSVNLDQVLPAPTFLTAPDCAPFLAPMYQRLKQLFPEQKAQAQGQTMAQGQGMAQQPQQGMGQVRQQPQQPQPQQPQPQQPQHSPPMMNQMLGQQNQDMGMNPMMMSNNQGQQQQQQQQRFRMPSVGGMNMMGGPPQQQQQQQQPMNDISMFFNTNM
ncbi:hypothetical protein CJU89_3558 [Yarrowia sp. B02]|nr:hypothetical protein CJU89_3558 [Yarrowia sp. B02]